MGKDNVIFALSSVTELLAALCNIFLIVYIMFFSESRVLLKNFLDFGFRYPPLGLVFFLIVFFWFFIIAAAMIFPFAIRTDARKNADLKYLYSVAAIGLGPWLDVLVTSVKDGFSAINLDRVAVLYLGIGTLAMVFAALSGKALSTRGALIIAAIALAGFAIFYTGLWIVGGMGNLFNILVWHGIVLYSGFSVFQEWLWFIREK
ncbi:MAG: hypothetical protein ACPL68_05155 [Candidatus Hydrothermia bacterium]